MVAMVVRNTIMQLSATLIALLSIHVADEGHAVNPSCSCIRFTAGAGGASRGTFSSPDFPHAYPRALCLLYTFIAQPHQIIEIVFSDFDVYKDHLE
ncbi:unnamed protein product [Pieris brassicae]|uniref:CUB domain-containing protein n=1 Tax=Pieris brassicae TaxID=7116 RepID=A0A9P0T2S1_PIEBR|nr:unnamed protein product [Pieris brassicae]